MRSKHDDRTLVGTAVRGVRQFLCDHRQNPGDPLELMYLTQGVERLLCVLLHVACTQGQSRVNSQENRRQFGANNRIPNFRSNEIFTDALAHHSPSSLPYARFQAILDVLKGIY